MSLASLKRQLDKLEGMVHERQRAEHVVLDAIRRDGGLVGRTVSTLRRATTGSAGDRATGVAVVGEVECGVLRFALKQAVDSGVKVHTFATSI